jgi:membrane protein
MATDVRTAGPDTPTDLPKRSWGATLKRTFREFKDDNVTDWAAALTYYAVLSLFPALIALVSILGLVVDKATITRVLEETLSSIGPASAIKTFKGPINEVTGNSSTAGILLIVGIAVSLWSASGYIGAFMRAANAVYDVREGRQFWKLRPLQVAITIVALVVALVVLAAMVLTGSVARAVGNSIGLGSNAVQLWNIVKWPVIAILALLLVAILYYVSPNVKQPRWRWVTPGGALGLALWAIASVGFAFYVSHMGSYNKTYGTLGGVVSFLVWLWITNLALLFGLEFDAELERERELAAGLPAEQQLQLPPRRAATA